ncbi:hypothetical protein [Streptomyces arboris]|uniref:hypothetical protein n=1 Tax=Streptomyces arboris TaxID=2600619 RepID=UPI003BF4AC52
MLENGYARGSLLAASVTIGLAFLVGCSGKADTYAVPSDICGVSVGKKATSSILPAGRELKDDHDPLGQDESHCDVYIDKYHALDVIIKSSESAPPAKELDSSTAHFTSRKEVNDFPFSSRTVLGDQGALIVAECGSPSRYLTFHIKVDSQRLNDGAGDVDGVSEFVQKFVPGVKKKIGCVR